MRLPGVRSKALQPVLPTEGTVGLGIETPYPLALLRDFRLIADPLLTRSANDRTSLREQHVDAASISRSPPQCPNRQQSDKAAGRLNCGRVEERMPPHASSYSRDVQSDSQDGVEGAAKVGTTA